MGWSSRPGSGRGRSATGRPRRPVAIARLDLVARLSLDLGWGLGWKCARDAVPVLRTRRDSLGNTPRSGAQKIGSSARYPSSAPLALFRRHAGICRVAERHEALQRGIFDPVRGGRPIQVVLVKPSVQYRGGADCVCAPRAGLRYSIPAGREGNRLLILGAMDPRDSRSRDASRRLTPTRAARPRPRISAARLMVNAKAGAAISGSAGDRHHLARQFHGRSSAR